ncbi:T9SS type A sorting domain-containing protein [Psychroserpens sp. XS_ASV72]|uniref:T9SS type A sorting domain-containing protein n=1 Tax=Psychroserpens sp. XS_ASV72 TaxID=3241293 RepID=UPI00351669C8
MKQLYILILLFVPFFALNAQIIDIPDPNFKNALVNTNCVDADGNGSFESDADTNDDGEITLTEALAISHLRIRQNSIVSLNGIENFTNLVHLDCSWNELTTLDISALATNLEEFYCSGNLLTPFNFNALINLTRLECSTMQLTELDVSALTNLKSLHCGGNLLTELDVSALGNLEHLSCSGNQLTELNISNLTSLISLGCSNNQLSILDISATENLWYLDCFSNQLSSINFGNNTNLDTVYCFDNQLTSLDVSTSAYISELDCSNNPNLTSIALGTSIGYLTLNYTGLIEVDFINTHIDYLNLRNNANLTYVQLGYLDYYNYHSYAVTDNPVLETISFKNGVTQLTGIDYDSGSYNICNNPNLRYVCADESEIHGYTYINAAMEEIDVEGIQDLVNNCGYTNVVVNAYCSFTPGGDYYTIEGNTILDIDNNGCDVNDVIFPYLNLTITGGSDSGSFISNASGYYYIPVSAVYGSHTLTPTLENPDYFTVSPSSISVDFPTDTSPYLQDFCITPNGAFNDLEITLIPINEARPGFDANYKIVYKNKGTTTLSGDIDFGFQDDVMDYVSAAPPNESGLTDLLSWSFTDLAPLESREILLTMNLNSPMENPPLNGDEQLSFIASLSISETDETPDDNTFELQQTVVNSFDPNDKTCLEGSTITPEQVGEFVHYRIRFENTGTADAVNIVVKDHIDRTKYDLSSLVPVDSSHDFVARITDSGADYYVEFIFENINLPFDDANNDGYVVFKIRTLDSLVLGDTFENEAEIYFDFNFPIITNEAQTTVATLSTEAFAYENEMLLYPNPTSGILNIETNDIIKHVCIYDLSGRIVQEISVLGSKSNLEITTEPFSSGTYFIKVRTIKGETVRKFIKD